MATHNRGFCNGIDDNVFSLRENISWTMNFCTYYVELHLSSNTSATHSDILFFSYPERIPLDYLLMPSAINWVGRVIFSPICMAIL